MVIVSEPGGDTLTGRVGVAARLAVLPDPRLGSLMLLENWSHVTCVFAAGDASNPCRIRARSGSNTREGRRSSGPQVHQGPRLRQHWCQRRLPEAIAMAHRHGFESVAPDIGYLKSISDSQLSELREDLKAKNLVWGGAGLSVNFRGGQAAFQDGLRGLADDAKALQTTPSGCSPARKSSRRELSPDERQPLPTSSPIPKRQVSFPSSLASRRERRIRASSPSCSISPFPSPSISAPASGFR